MRKTLYILIMVLTLTGCGAATVGQTTAEPIRPLAARANGASGSAPIDMSQSAPDAASNQQPLVVIVAPTAAPTSANTLPPLVQQGYTTLAMLQAAATLLGERMQPQATDAASGVVQGAIQRGQQMAINALLDRVETSLVDEAPDPALADAWSSARQLAPQLKQLSEAWSSQHLADQQVPEQLGPIRANIDRLLSSASEKLGTTYGIDATTLQAAVGDVLARLRSEIAQ